MTTNTAIPERANIFSLLIDILGAPRQAFRQIRYYPGSWWLLALLAVLTGFLNLWLNLPFVVPEAKKQLEIQLANQNLSGDQLEAACAAGERFTEPNAILIQGAIALVVGLLVAWVLGTLIIYLSSSLSGSNIKPIVVWSAVVWSWMPFVIRNLWQSVWITVTGDYLKYPGMAYFVATGDSVADRTNPLVVAAAQVDIFSLWHVILIYFLLRTIPRMGTGGSFFVTLLYALINVGVRVGFSQIGALVGGG